MKFIRKYGNLDTVLNATGSFTPNSCKHIFSNNCEGVIFLLRYYESAFYQPVIAPAFLRDGKRTKENSQVCCVDLYADLAVLLVK